MNFAVIGSGGREHAICYKLKQSPKIKKLVCIPGNAGTQKIAENINEDISNFDAISTIGAKFAFRAISISVGTINNLSNCLKKPDQLFAVIIYLK